MQLYRFSAADNHQAMLKVHSTLGAEALIYSTRKSNHGVEILAGLSHDVTEISDIAEMGKQPAGKSQGASKGKQKGATHAVADVMHVNNAVDGYQLAESVNNQLQVMVENIRSLTEKVSVLQSAMDDMVMKRKFTIDGSSLKNVAHNIKSFWIILKNFSHVAKSLKKGAYQNQTIIH